MFLVAAHISEPQHGSGGPLFSGSSSDRFKCRSDFGAVPCRNHVFIDMRPGDPVLSVSACMHAGIGDACPDQTEAVESPRETEICPVALDIADVRLTCKRG